MTINMIRKYAFQKHGRIREVFKKTKAHPPPHPPNQQKTKYLLLTFMVPKLDV